MKSDRSAKYSYLAAAFIILHSSFYLLNQSNLLYVPFFIVGVASLFHFVCSKTYRLDGSGYSWLWIVCGLLVCVGCYINSGRLLISSVVFLLCTILLYVNADKTDWIVPFYKVITIVMLIYAASTILFYVFPWMYPPFKHLFFNDVAEATDYRSGLTSHYSFNGTYIAVGLVSSASLAFFFSDTRNERRWKLISLVMCAALILTTKRAHLLSCAVAIMLAYALVRREGKFSKTVLAACAVAFLLLIGNQFIPGISESLDRLLGTVGNETSDGTLMTRPILWQYAMSALNDRLFFGHGWGTFAYYWANGEVTLIAHNELFNLLFEEGVIGTFLLTGMALYSLINTIRLIFHCKDIVLSGYLIGSLCLQVFSVVYGYSTGTLFSYEITFIPYFIGIATYSSCRYRMRFHTDEIGNMRSNIV